MRKIFITPFFGDLPPWWPQFKDHFGEFLAREGYSWLFTQDLADFNQRCDSKLGFVSPITWGSGKLWDYRPTLGLLYDDLIRDFKFWGHTDFDCCFGRVSNWVSDSFLEDVDVHSNHDTYVCGAWSLYRNISRVNNLFREVEGSLKILEARSTTGWVEDKYSRALEASGLRYWYTFWQGNPYTVDPQLRYKDGRLYQDNLENEIMMFHFRRSKKWPL